MRVKYLFVILALLFFAGFALRISIFGLHDFPAYAKNYDSVNHAMLAKGFYEGHLKLMPPYLAMGRPDVVMFQPPFPYLFSAVVSWITGMQYFNGYLVAMALLDSLSIISVFFITRHLFNDDSAPLLASALLVAPFPASIWFSTYSLGMFNVIFAYGLFSLGSWAVLSYHAAGSRWKIIPMAAIGSALVLTHLPEAALFITLSGLVIVSCNKKKDLFKELGLYLLLLVPAMLYFAPRVIHVWGPFKPLGFHLSGEVMSALGFMLSLDTMFHLLPMISLLLVGSYLLTRRSFSSREIIWIYLISGLSLICFILISYVNEAEYIIKLKYLFPLLLAPIVAQMVVRKILPAGRRWAWLAASVLMVLLVSSYAFYGFHMALSRGYLLDEERYRFMLDVREMTAPEDSIIALDGFTGWICLFSERQCFEATKAVGPDTYYGIHAGYSMNLPHLVDGRWESGRDILGVDYLYSKENITDFDYIIATDRTSLPRGSRVVFSEDGYSLVSVH